MPYASPFTGADQNVLATDEKTNAIVQHLHARIAQLEQRLGEVLRSLEITGFASGATRYRGNFSGDIALTSATSSTWLRQVFTHGSQNSFRLVAAWATGTEYNFGLENLVANGFPLFAAGINNSVSINNNGAPEGQLGVYAFNASRTVLYLRGATSQSNPFIRAADSADTTRFSVSSTGATAIAGASGEATPLSVSAPNSYRIPLSSSLSTANFGFQWFWGATSRFQVYGGESSGEYNWAIQNDTVGNFPLFIKGNTSFIGVNTSSPGGHFHVQSRAIASIVGLLQGMSGQTANVLECRDNAGTNLFSVSPSGAISTRNNVIASKTASQTLAGGANAITWTVAHDPNSAFNGTTGVFTVPTGQAGFYEFVVQMSMNRTAGSSAYDLYLELVVGATIYRMANVIGQNTAYVDLQGAMTIDQSLSAGTTVTVRVNATLNGNTIVVNTFSGYVFNTLQIRRVLT